jgi:hypothetical protein
MQSGAASDGIILNMNNRRFMRSSEGALLVLHVCIEHQLRTASSWAFQIGPLSVPKHSLREWVLCTVPERLIKSVDWYT